MARLARCRGDHDDDGNCLPEGPAWLEEAVGLTVHDDDRPYSSWEPHTPLGGADWRGPTEH